MLFFTCTKLYWCLVSHSSSIVLQFLSDTWENYYGFRIVSAISKLCSKLNITKFFFWLLTSEASMVIEMWAKKIICTAAWFNYYHIILCFIWDETGTVFCRSTERKRIVILVLWLISGSNGDSLQRNSCITSQCNLLIPNRNWNAFK
jgi:hypothetical protein